MSSPLPKKPWFIADPIHKILDLDKPYLKPLIGAPAFQRLRRISQLGLASYVFPGAVHTRFSHCLGAAHLARRVTKHLIELHADEELQQHQEAIECAALLHDIGHGPFSHSFERALKRILKSSTAKHEDWTREIVNRCLPSLNESMRASIASVIAPDSKLPIAAARSCSLVREIVSSQLDVDRMDYLVRDSHFTGASAGEFDLDYLIHSLRIVAHGSQKTLGLAANGVVCYEAFAFGRHCMNRSVYRHRAVATFECMMEECLHRIATSPEGARLRSMPSFFAKLHAKPPASKAELLDEYLVDYLELTEDRIWAMLTEAALGTSKLAQLCKALLLRQPVQHRAIAIGREKMLEEQLERAGFAQHCSIVDLGSILYKHRSDTRVFVVDAQVRSQPRDVSELSSLVQTFRDRDEGSFLLVMFDQQDDILRVAGDADCVAPQPIGARGPTVANARPRASSEGSVPPADPANDVSRKSQPDE